MNNAAQKIWGAAAIECIIDLFFFISFYTTGAISSIPFSKIIFQKSEFLCSICIGELVDFIGEGGVVTELAGVLGLLHDMYCIGLDV